VCSYGTYVFLAFRTPGATLAYPRRPEQRWGANLEQGKDTEQKDLQIENNGPVAHIEEIQRQLSGHDLRQIERFRVLVRKHCFLIPVHDLRQTGKARSHLKEGALLGGVMPDVLWRLRSRPHNAHLSPQDVDHLRKFVELGFPEHAAYRRNPWITATGDAGPGRMGVHHHGSELVQQEGSAMPPHAHRAVQDESSRGQPDGQRSEDSDRKQEQAGKRGKADIKCTLRDLLNSPACLLCQREYQLPAESASNVCHRVNNVLDILIRHTRG